MKTLFTLLVCLTLGIVAQGQEQQTPGALFPQFWDVVRTTPTISTNTVREIQHLDVTNLIFVTDAGLVYYNTVTDTWFDHADDIYLNPSCYLVAKSVAFENNLIATDIGIFELDDPTDHPLRFVFTPEIKYNDIAYDNNGVIWLASEQGVYRNIAPTNAFTFFDVTNSNLVSDTVNCIIVDNNDNKWIGTALGLNVYNTTWTTYTINDGLTSNYVTDLAEDINGYIWAGTDMGLNMWDGISWTTIDTSNGLIGNHINNIMTSGDSVWVCTNNGLSFWDGNTWQNFQNFPSNNITCIYNDGTYYWLGLEKYGVVKWLPDNSINEHIYDLGMLSNNIYDVLLTPDHTLWLATEQGISQQYSYSGQYSLAYTMNWDAIRTQDGIIGNDVRALAYNLIDNSVWAGTTTGLSHIDNDSIINYTTNDSLPNNFISDIEITPEGAVWVATANGLALKQDSSWLHFDTTNTPLNSNNILQIAYYSVDSTLWVRTDSPTVHYLKDSIWVQIDVNVGLPSNQITSINALERTSSQGTPVIGLYIGTALGVRSWENNTINAVGSNSFNTLAPSTMGSGPNDYFGEEFIIGTTNHELIIGSSTGALYIEESGCNFLDLRNVNEQYSGLFYDYSDLLMVTNGGLRTFVRTGNVDNISLSSIPLHLYPNPSNHSINIEGIEEEGSISIYNLQGQLLYQEQVFPNDLYSIDVKQLPQGMYILHYQTDEGVGTQQFIKQ